MKISHFLAKYAILAAILNLRTLAVSNVIGGQIIGQIHVRRQILPWKQPVSFQICKKKKKKEKKNQICPTLMLFVIYFWLQLMLHLLKNSILQFLWVNIYLKSYISKKWNF